MDSTTHLANDGYCAWRTTQSRRDRKASKRVSFLDSDLVATIPNNESTTVSYPAARRTLGGKPALAYGGSAKVLSEKSHPKLVGHHDEGMHCNTANGRGSTVKEIKSILKRSLTENSATQRSFTTMGSNSYFEPLTLDFKAQNGFNQETSYDGPMTLHNSSLLSRKTLVNSSVDYTTLDSQKMKYKSPFSTIFPVSRSTAMSPSRTTNPKQGFQSRPRSQSSPASKSFHISKDTEKDIGTPTFVRNKSESIGVVGSTMNITDLYPVLNDFPKYSMNKKFSSFLNESPLGVGDTRSKYISARERISRAGNNAHQFRRQARSLGSGNFAGSSTTGLNGVAETSLLNRLRKFEHSEPYIAWQAVARNSRQTSPSTSSSQSYILPKRTSFERSYPSKDLTSQYYY